MSTDCEPRSVSHAFDVLVNLIMELSPMSNISVKFAFALVVAFASLGASFARHGGLAATRNIGSSGAAKCFQGSRATAAERNRAEFVHPEGVCRAPQANIDGPGV